MAIRELDSDEYVGHAALYVSDIATDNDREILFYLHKKFWGRGLALDAASLMFEQARQAKYATVWATVDSGHRPSIQVCERAGMAFDRKEHDEDGEFLVYRYDI